MNRLRMYPDLNNESHGRTNSESDSMKSELIEIGKQYLKSTSIKGIAKASKTQSWFLMIIWIFGTIAGLGCAVFLVFTLTNAYFNYETVIKINKCTNCDPEFPDLTVCNLNSLGAVNDIPDVHSYAAYKEELEQLFFNNSQRNITDFTDEERNRLWVLYSTTAYLHNIDHSVLAYFETAIGLNSIAHDCKW